MYHLFNLAVPPDIGTISVSISISSYIFSKTKFFTSETGASSGLVSIQMKYLICNHELFPIYGAVKNGRVRPLLHYTFEIMIEFFAKEN